MTEDQRTAHPVHQTLLRQQEAVEREARREAGSYRVKIQQDLEQERQERAVQRARQLLVGRRSTLSISTTTRVLLGPVQETSRNGQGSGNLDLPFGPPGGHRYQTLDEPLGLRFSRAFEDPADTLVREVEANIVRHYREYALFFALMAVAIAAVGIATNQLGIEFLTPSLLAACIVAFAAFAAISAFVSNLLLRMTEEVRLGLQARRASIRAAALRRSIDEQPWEAIGGTSQPLFDPTLERASLLGMSEGQVELPPAPRRELQAKPIVI